MYIKYSEEKALEIMRGFSDYGGDHGRDAPEAIHWHEKKATGKDAGLEL